MVDKERVNDILGELNNNPEVMNAVVISRSGMHIAGQPPEGVHLETFVTMLTILLTASETAISELKGKLQDVFVELDKSRIIIDSAGNKGLLVVVTNTKDNFDSLHAQVKNANRNLAAVL